MNRNTNSPPTTGQENEGYELDNMAALNGVGNYSYETKLAELPREYANRQKQLEAERQTYLERKFHKYRSLIHRILQTLLHILVGGYFGYAIYYFIESENDENTRFDAEKRCHGRCGYQWCDGFGMLLLLITFIYIGLFYYLIFKPTIGKKLYQNFIRPFFQWKNNLYAKRIGAVMTIGHIISILIAIIIIGGIVIFLYIETRGNEERLTSLIGPVIFVGAGYIFSTNRQAIKWRTVLTGLLAQFLLGILCIRWEVGRQIFQCIGDKIVTFLRYSEAGSRFVFSNEIVNNGVFAFAILPVIFFFSFSISILYYLGVMQWVVIRMGWILQKLLGTTVCESVNGAANIFLGMSETPLLIRPYIKHLTLSELHAIMASGFATVSGTVLAAYASFGASPSLLVTSTVMAAPAALAMSKLYFPETEESKTKSDNIKLEKSEDSSILDAASNGANGGIVIILGIIANLVAFVAFIEFLNGVINWLGYLVGLEHITFEWIFSKLFIPLSWIMGVEWKDCDTVGKVVASKTIINEFIAYERLGKYINNGQLESRSAGIATFAICGFANPSSLGILIGTLSAMCPERRPQITAVALRSFVVGSVVCFTSASFAGLLMPDSFLPSPNPNATLTTIMPPPPPPASILMI